LRGTHFGFHVGKVFGLPLDTLELPLAVLRFHRQPQEFESRNDVAGIELTVSVNDDAN